MLKDLKLDTTVEKNIKTWQKGKYDQETKDELNKLIDDKNVTQLTDSFYKNLEFGTGGMRGELGIGSNRMNAAPRKAPMIEPTPPMMIMNRILNDISSEKPSGSTEPR